MSEGRIDAIIAGIDAMLSSMGEPLVTLTELWEVNRIILYFISGLVFFVTGLVTGLQWRRQSRLELARPLPWLAAFGIAYGLNEWGYIFIPLQALYLSDVVVRFMIIAHLLLLAVSFFFLFQFGVELLLPLLPGHGALRILPAAALLLWGIAVFLRGALAGDPLDVLFAIGNAWARYLLCLPGAILASRGLWRQARQMRRMALPRISRYLQGASFAFLFYALIAGFLVPAAPIAVADRVNYEVLESITGVPIPVLLSLCGLAMAFFVVRSLEVFQVEIDRRLTEMEQAQVLAADRERIGRELHDGIIQKIYAAGLGLEDAYLLVAEDQGQAQNRIRGVMQALNDTIMDIRRYILDLRVAEQSRELETVLETLVQELRLDTMLEVDLEVVGQRCCWLGSEQVGHVTQFAREALSNVVQHAEAKQVTVNLSYLGGRTRLTVTDNGRGIDGNPGANNGLQGQGLANMRNRAAQLGGELEMESEPGRGTRLVLTIPCEDGKGTAMAVEERQETWA